MIHLRPLTQADAPGMLAWMRDAKATQYLTIDHTTATLEGCRAFIARAASDPSNRHFAIAGDDDTYLGTVSLKQVDASNGTAEYAIAVAPAAWGTNAAAEGTRLVLAYAFEHLGLAKVYLNVAGSNHRARRFYDKLGMSPEGCFRSHAVINGHREDLYWYAVFPPGLPTAITTEEN